MHLNKILEQIKRHQSPTEAIERMVQKDLTGRLKRQRPLPIKWA